MLFGLDAGHCTSGADTGAQGNGYKEQDLTRQVVTYLSEYLEKEGHTTKYCHCNSASTVNESLRYRVNKGFLKDTATKELIETWRVANQKEKDLLSDKDYITLNNSEVIS